MANSLTKLGVRVVFLTESIAVEVLFVRVVVKLSLLNWFMEHFRLDLLHKL